VAAVFAVSVVAWSPTQDTAGPLTVGIEGPSALTETGSPFVAVIVLENKGDTALPGTLRVGLFDGHRLSTTFVGLDFESGLSIVQAVDAMPSSFDGDPAARHYSLHTPHEQTLSFVPAASVWEAVTVWRGPNGMRPSGGVDKLAGCFVFDLWGGRYADTARALGRAASYGLQDSMVVWHNWQRWGYDYPDAEGFSYEHIAAGRDGAPVKAWLNEGRQAQSYRWRADRLTPFLERNLRAVRDGFAPTGYFILKTAVGGLPNISTPAAASICTESSSPQTGELRSS
jgi:hypothetical protein